MPAQSPDPATISLYTAYLGDLQKIGERHQTVRQFYISVMTALFAFLALANDKGALFAVQPQVRLVGGGVGLAICLLWFLQMGAYQTIYGAKIATLERIEAGWPVQPFVWEGERMAPARHHIRLTAIDRLIAVAFAGIFVALAAWR